MVYIEVGHSDRYVLAVAGTRLDRWLKQGFELVTSKRLLGTIDVALSLATLTELEPLWRALVGSPMPDNVARRAITDRLEQEAHGRQPSLLLLARMVVRNVIEEPVVFKREPVGPQRLSTEHYVVIETVDEQDRPAPSIRCELVIAGGEVRTVSTGAQGVVRVDRIQAGRVIIRLVDLDGSMWHPRAGAASQLSSGGSRSRVHVVKQGDNLTRIAKSYGIKGWKKLWDAPGNEKLRKKRKNPHVLYPGDKLVVPGLEVHEIVRSTDQTHLIVVTEELLEFRVVLQDHNQLPYKNEPYELRLTDAPDEAPRQGTSDGNGKIVEQVPSSTGRVEVFLPAPNLRWAFAIGELLPIPDQESLKDKSDPATPALTVKALQTRLLALGFPCGQVDGKVGPLTRAALALWQGEQTETGEGPTDDAAQPGEDDFDHGMLAALDKAYEVVA